MIINKAYQLKKKVCFIFLLQILKIRLNLKIIYIDFEAESQVFSILAY